MTYYVPRGGLPAQTELTTGASGRAVFTEAYAVLPRGTMSDIVTSRLPHWDDTRLWVIARPLSGFAETFSWKSCAEDFVRNLQPYPEPEKTRFWRRLRRLARVRRRRPEAA